MIRTGSGFGTRNAGWSLLLATCLLAHPVSGAAQTMMQQPQTSPFLGSRAQGTPTTQPLPLSLMGAIDRGLQYNLGLLLQEQSVESARGARWRALADLLPNVYTSFGADRQIINLEAYGFKSENPLVGPFNLVDARVYASQPLLDLHALNNERAASANERAEAHGIQTARDLVVLVAVNLYLQTIAATSRAEAAHAQLQTAEALFQQASDMKNSGIVAGIDVLRAQVQVQNQRGRTIVADNDLERSKLELARAIGLPVSQPIVLTDTIPYAPLDNVTLESALARAYESRGDYLAARERLAAAEASQKAAASEWLPTIRLDADWGAIGQTLGTSRMTYRLATRVRLPIFDAGRSTADRIQAAAELKRRQAELDDFRGRVEFEVRTAVLDLQAAEKRLEAARTNVTLADQELQQARDRFAAGIASSIEVTQAQEAVAAASDTYINALYAHNLGKASLARAVGTTEASVKAYLGGSK